MRTNKGGGKLPPPLLLLLFVLYKIISIHKGDINRWLIFVRNQISIFVGLRFKFNATAY